MTHSGEPTSACQIQHRSLPLPEILPLTGVTFHPISNPPWRTMLTLLNKGFENTVVENQLQDLQAPPMWIEHANRTKKQKLLKHLDQPPNKTGWFVWPIQRRLVNKGKSFQKWIGKKRQVKIPPLKKVGYGSKPVGYLFGYGKCHPTFYQFTSFIFFCNRSTFR